MAVNIRFQIKYSEILMHALSLCNCLIESFFNFIKSALDELWNSNCGHPNTDSPWLASDYSRTKFWDQRCVVTILSTIDFPTSIFSLQQSFVCLRKPIKNCCSFTPPPPWSPVCTLWLSITKRIVQKTNCDIFDKLNYSIIKKTVWYKITRLKALQSNNTRKGLYLEEL